MVAPFEFADFVNCMHFDTFCGECKTKFKKLQFCANVTTVMFSQGAKTNTEIPLEMLAFAAFCKCARWPNSSLSGKKAGLKRVCQTSLKSSFSAETTRKKRKYLLCFDTHCDVKLSVMFSVKNYL